MLKMETTTKSKIANGSALTIAVIALIMSLSPGLITSEKAHVCLEPQLAMECDRLSNPNAEGLITRCYFFSEELNRTTYKMCNTGWVKFSKIEYSNILTEEGKLCKVYKENSLIKECKTENETYLYIIRNN